MVTSSGKTTGEEVDVANDCDVVAKRLLSEDVGTVSGKDEIWTAWEVLEVGNSTAEDGAGFESGDALRFVPERSSEVAGTVSGKVEEELKVLEMGDANREEGALSEAVSERTDSSDTAVERLLSQATGTLSRTDAVWTAWKVPVAGTCTSEDGATSAEDLASVDLPDLAVSLFPAVAPARPEAALDGVVLVTFEVVEATAEQVWAP